METNCLDYKQRAWQLLCSICCGQTMPHLSVQTSAM